MICNSVLTAALGVALTAGIASAHEFWIAPEAYSVSPGGTIAAHLRIGQDFKGASYSYNPVRIEKFQFGLPGDLLPVEGRVGDRPALRVEAPQKEGLRLVVHETKNSTVTYSAWEKFASFAQNHDLGDVAARQAARGLPDAKFVESYRRYSKSLIAVGHGAGADALVGLDVEILVLTNPYELSPGAPVEVQLFEGGQVRAGAQLEVFTRIGEDRVELSKLRADADGRVLVPSTPNSEVMLNFVVLQERDGDPDLRQPVWHSLWASTTYHVP